MGQYIIYNLHNRKNKENTYFSSAVTNVLKLNHELSKILKYLKDNMYD